MDNENKELTQEEKDKVKFNKEFLSEYMRREEYKNSPNEVYNVDFIGKKLINKYTPVNFDELNFKLDKLNNMINFLNKKLKEDNNKHE